jgi:hypothetical protein
VLLQVEDLEKHLILVSRYGTCPNSTFRMVCPSCEAESNNLARACMRAGALNLMRFAKRSTNRDIKLNSFGPVAYTAAQEKQVTSPRASLRIIAFVRLRVACAA